MPTTLVSLRIDNDLLEYLKERAEQEHRSLSNMIVSILMVEKELRERKEGEAAEISNNIHDDEIKLKPCPLCGRDVEWRDGRIMCWCGIMFKNRNYISTCESWNQRDIEKPNCSELPNSLETEAR